MRSEIDTIAVGLAVDRVCRSWLGTPWVSGQCCRGPAGGVDCVHFVVAVMDELHGRVNEPPARLPAEMSLHDRAGAIAAVHAIASRYEHDQIDGDRDHHSGSLSPYLAEPGDIVIVRRGRGGPGHVAIVGQNPAVLWHACPGVGVCRTSLGVLGGNVARVYRPRGKHQWR